MGPKAAATTASSSSHHMITRSKKASNDRNNESRQCKKICFATNNHKGTAALFLPMEITEEILKYLDVRSLLRFKCMCKHLHTLIQDPHFIKKHACHASAKRHYEAKNFECIHCYNGLMLELRSNASKNKFRVRNPAIRQVFDLPDPPEEPVAMAISHSPSSGLCKVISLHPDEGETEVGRIGIFALGSVDRASWKFLDMPSNLHLSADDVPRLFSLEGVVHFVTLGRPTSKDYELASLDLDKECLTSTILPRNLLADWSNIYSIIYAFDVNKRYFAVADIVKDELSILVLEDYKKGKWADEKIKIPLALNPEMKKIAKPYEVCQDYVWFRGHGHSTFTYSIGRKKIISRFSLLQKRRSFYTKRSLITFNGMRPE